MIEVVVFIEAEGKRIRRVKLDAEYWNLLQSCVRHAAGDIGAEMSVDGKVIDPLRKLGRKLFEIDVRDGEGSWGPPPG